jgi:amino acid adenylation domain-containing protein
MSQISTRIPELSSQDKRQLLAQLLQKQAQQAKITFPLSANQQALWFLYKLAPASWAYNVVFSARILSPVDVSALKTSFQTLSDRHASLRTTYSSDDGTPQQQVHPTLPVDFQQIDASGWSAEQAQEVLISEARCPFDLEVGPVMRIRLLTQTPDQHILLMVIHHIAVDLWSLMILLDELRSIYSAQKTGAQLNLPPLDLPAVTVHYGDYVQWQKQMLDSAAGERLRQYWHQQLSGELPLLNLATDHPRPAVQNFAGASQTFQLSLAVTQQLKALAKAEEVTLYMTLLAAYQVLLYRFTGQEEICVGSPTAGRMQREFSGLVGDLINSVVLRGNLSGNPSFKNFLVQVRNTVLAALQHQNYPFSHLVESLHPNQGAGRSPLFQTLFNFQKLPRMEELSEFILPIPSAVQVKFGELTLQPYPLAHQEGQFDLTLEMIETGGTLKGNFKYNSELFEHQTIARIVSHFQTLLESIVSQPETSVSSLALLTSPERHQLLTAWNATQTDFSVANSIHQQFEAQVQRTPQAIAVVCGDRQLTYQALNQQANQLAHCLQAQGVDPDSLVGLLMERSLDMVVALLGILKAGGAYVPLDPSYPQQRLIDLLSAAKIPLLLTQEKLVHNLSTNGLPQSESFAQALAANGTHLFVVDAHWNAIAEQPKTNPDSHVKAEQLAYVIHTSGSTGQPKGVMVEHRSVLNLADALGQAIYAHHPADQLLRVSLNGSISFDTSVKQIVQLLQGHTLEIIPEAIRFDGAALLSHLQDHRVDVFDCTPSQLELLIAAGLLEQAISPQIVLVGGEPISESLWKTLAVAENIHFYNVYGPTECTVDATVCPITASATKPAIGRPIANVQTYILDRHLQPVPIGVVGELYVGGAGVARGYLNRPDLTAERFVPDLCGQQSAHQYPAPRLYRTGDLARYRADGQIEYQGRSDQQVKIRGFRIELGEIAALLKQDPQVQDAIAIVREDTPGDQRLVAYVVPQTPATTVEKLRQLLIQKLPNYMVPSAIVLLDRLPLTSNGKVDRWALPAPDHAQFSSTTDYVAPQDKLELELTQIWQQVLNCQGIGVRDNFFEIGGHSLLVVRLFAKIQKKFGQNLPLSTLFQAPTVAELAEILRQLDCSSSWSSLVPIQSRGTKPPLFCVHDVFGDVLSYGNLVHHLGEDQPIYGLQAQGLDGRQVPCTEMKQIAANYIQEIKTVQPQGPYFLAGHSFGGIAIFEMAQQLYRQGDQVGLLALFDTFAPRTCVRLSFRERLPIHLENISRGGWGYLWQKGQQWQSWVKNRLEKIQYKLYKKAKRAGINLSLPHTLRNFYMREACDRALSAYEMQVYPGHLTLFQLNSESRFEGVGFQEVEPQMGWGKWVQGGLDIQSIEGSHASVLQEPHVKLLAEKLKTCLVKASTAE